MAAPPGFEPGKCQSQSLMPYRLATEQKMVELTRLELVSKNNFILEISFLHYKFYPDYRDLSDDSILTSLCSLTFREGLDCAVVLS